MARAILSAATPGQPAGICPAREFGYLPSMAGSKSRRSQAKTPRPGVTAAIRRFLHMEAAGGVVLAVAALVAVVVKNSAWGPAYDAWLADRLTVQIAGWIQEKSVASWIKDGLMAIFFLLVGLEIKREILVGELSDPKRLALPVLGAIGGMVAPALVYVMVWALSGGDSQELRGWPIPMATDIAFAVAVLSLAGGRVPMGLKVFLLTLAIVDDLGAIAMIAILFTGQLNVAALGGAIALLAVLHLANRFGQRAIWPYLAVGVVIWALVLESGVNATVAGVLLATAIPLRNPPKGEARSPLQALEHGLHPWVAYGILPIFAFAAAGFSFDGLSFASLGETVPLAVALGLLIGKPIGIMGAAWVATRVNLARLPEGATWLQMLGVTFVAGIGFTMSLFVGALAFRGLNPDYLVEMRLGVIFGSIVASAIGLWLITFGARRTRARQS